MLSTDTTLYNLLVTIAVAALVVGFFALTSQLFFIIFTGLLVGLLFDGLVQAVHHKLVDDRQAAAAITLFVLLVGLAAFFFFGAGPLTDQLTELLGATPDSFRQLEAQFAGYPWVQSAIDQAASIDYEALLSASGEAGESTFLVGVLTMLATFFTILFIGLYVAFEPSVYKKGVLKMLPKKRRQKTRKLLKNVTSYLRWWLVAKFAAMLFVGVITGLGLWLLGVPYFILLAVVAAVATFIPNIGPVLAAFPAMLVALPLGATLALYVAVFYLFVQLVESYVLTPLVERKVVYLPPALTLGAQIFLGLWFGLIGVAVAAPLVVAVMVVVDSLYMDSGMNTAAA